MIRRRKDHGSQERTRERIKGGNPERRKDTWQEINLLNITVFQTESWSIKSFCRIRFDGSPFNQRCSRAMHQEAWSNIYVWNSFDFSLKKKKNKISQASESHFGKKIIEKMLKYKYSFIINANPKGLRSCI